MRFGSVCSGIEAASTAWNPLGWKAAWFSEIEAFPSAVLAHHHPDVPNLGDMTLLPGMIRSGEVEAPDVFCGGTPCQAFSVAGKRQSLDDARGNLSLIFCEIANAIDDIRHDRGEQPSIVFWENVPGVLSTKDNAFGCFLAQLCGGDEPLHAPDGWPDAGCVSGERRTAAWRVLDAQYFGLAQRRRRVFVVASARDGFDPAAVLFEFDGVRLDTAPSREAGKEVAPTIAGCANGGGANGPGRDVDSVESLQIVTMAHGQAKAEIAFDRGPTLACNHEAPIVAFPANLSGTQCASTENLQPMDDLSPNLTSTDRHAVASAVCFQQNTRDEVRLIGGEGNLAGALAASAGMKQTNYIAQPFPINRFPAVLQPVAMINMQGSKGNAVVQVDGPSFTLNAMHGHDVHAILAPITQYVEAAGTLTARHDSSPCHDRGMNVAAFPANLSGTQCTSTENLSPALGAMNPTAVAQPVGTDLYNGSITGDVAATMGTPGSSSNASGPTVMQSMQVRRLTPTECERLQGFPDGYTLVPHRGKPAADGPRYKSLGNSWAVPVVAWIGKRIHNHLKEQA
jgi:DNA (cytosine-5)-methyltransferase 1